ncbi:MAG: helix-turn-helix domain-containing protein [Chloroflexi bacterium]|nr:helix-turn-helix domain-containing protein [Chloroflexota bacterium]
MFALITFFIGLFILFKGSFRLGNRSVTQAQARTIGFYLMAPLGILFCASTLLVYNYIEFSPDGTFTIAADAFNYVSNTIGIIELIAVGIAVMLVAFTIYGTPAGNAAPTRNTAPVPQRPQPAAPQPTAATAPNIMTVAEAAAYMRVTEKEVLGLIDQGKLGAARIGDTYRIAKIAIEDFMGRS